MKGCTFGSLLFSMKAQEHANFIKQEAKRLGFLDCGIAKAEFLEKEAPRLEAWLNKGYHGSMQYMENHFDKRLDPTLLVDGAKSVISLSYNYYPEKRQRTDSYHIAKYAYGEDYHHVIKAKLKELLLSIQDKIGQVNGRAFVDSAPVLERAWAEKAGLGWNGKHTLLIQKQQGSFFFLAELIVDLELTYDLPFTTDHCGDCTKCIDACPTQAILPTNELDASKCISYFTIELKDQLPNQYANQFEDWMFGCDICQDVCPWNRFSKPHQEPLFNPKEALLNHSKREWQEITEATFAEVFKKSAVKRTKYAGLQRNISFLNKA